MRNQFWPYFFCLGLTLTGCSANRVDLKETGYLSIEEQVTKNVSLTSVAYDEEGSMLVFGTIDRTSGVGAVPGHLHIKIVEPTGEEFANLVAKLNRMPSYRHDQNPPSSYFLRLPGLPTKGASILISYDTDSHGASFNERQPPQSP